MSRATHSFVHNMHCMDNNCMGSCQSRLQQLPHTFPKAPSFSYSEKYNYGMYEKNSDDSMNYERFQMNYRPPDRNVPYLLLPARLSLVWVNKWTIALILIFIRLFFFMLSFKKDMNVVQDRMEDAYALMQYSANAVAATPRLMAIGTNKVIVLGVENSVRALNKVLLLTLIGFENIIFFFIEVITHTWTCLLELSVKGGINIIADVVEKITNFVNSALQSIEKDVVNGIQEVNNGLSSILHTIENTLKVLGKSVSLPPLTISSVNKLSNVTIPKNYDDELRKLQYKISLDPVKKVAKEAIAFPFARLRELINNTFSNYSFDISLLPSFKDRHRKILTRWFLSYIFHPSSLFVLGLGILGIISCGLQFILLSIMKKNISVSFSEIDIRPLIAENLQRTSSKWSSDVNSVLNETSTTMNNHLFGWVYQSTRHVNNTLNVFIDTTASSLKQIFGGTILYKPVLEVLNCMLLVKLRGIEKGLTWIYQNARISFPYVPDDILTSVDNSTSHHAFLNTSNGLSRRLYFLLRTLVDGYEKSIILETKISCAMVVFAKRPNIRGMGGGTHSHFPPRGGLRHVCEEDLYDCLSSKTRQCNADISKETVELSTNPTNTPFVINNNILHPTEPKFLRTECESNSDNIKKHHNGI
ncbi:hypothetical protein PORY_001537 [Pneumocystis oryctolagi]|uniref:Uncharacterized protein n=1 Tax=Pneumocystis oryctolagi TaxID=42067 RepID=A0ACB7CAV1_9ASCO|nr:hypothetical protein PORY_001537 [Pneumocystis oryctolagi]